MGTTYTYHPAVKAVKGTEGIPPTPAQIIESLNEGWNSWARSINPVNTDEYYLFTLPYGVRGAFIGFDNIDMQADGTAQFYHGLMISIEGIRVYESGEVVTVMAGDYLNDSRIRISRQIDNSIVYVVSTDTDTFVYKSLVAPDHKNIPAYVYGYLYISGDELLTSEITSGEVNFGSA